MQFNILFLLPLGAAVVKAAATGPKLAEAPIEGYSVFVPQWEVQATPGGETLIMSGTVQEVLDKLRKANPYYDDSFLNEFNVTASEENEQTEALRPRADFTGAPANCDPWELAGRNRIYQGIEYLERIGGKPHNAAGPAACGRVSCSYNSAIEICNDDSKPKTLNSFKDIADGARYVDHMCHRWESTRLAGQVHHKDKWNVIVRWARC
ncbi:hypothetical protein CkaCkLH20_12134 [Colletotrichum karsti]|uniref:Secreted protein n=1 Tax=Colletotrichum karsti TaxID=1095194 RepID=A0A9P6LFL0_9PEZI|nr:uncharacterized protein CkaCkLH20_12134 [Colletotrichum karsti]KAF9870467.1 hypothetical protein CkaCkLH20_12134 [Colletotrichum karsti]